MIIPSEAHLSIGTAPFIAFMAAVSAARSLSFSTPVPLVTMENSLAPELAAFSAASTSSSGEAIGYSLTSVGYFIDWAQKEQSSLHSPLLALTIEQRFTSMPLCLRLTFSVTARMSYMYSSVSPVKSSASLGVSPVPESPLSRAVISMFIRLPFSICRSVSF